MLWKAWHEDVVPIGVKAMCERLELPRRVGQTVEEDDHARGRGSADQQNAARARNGNAVVGGLPSSDRRDRALIRRWHLRRCGVCDREHQCERHRAGGARREAISLKRWRPRSSRCTTHPGTPHGHTRPCGHHTAGTTPDGQDPRRRRTDHTSSTTALQHPNPTPRSGTCPPAARCAERRVVPRATHSARRSAWRSS